MSRWRGTFAHRLKKDEGGAILVLSAILLLALLSTVALVIDLAALRQDVRISQLVSDFSATAGALELDPDFGGSPYAACQSAWAYFLANSPEAPSSAADPCDAFPTDGSYCAADTPPVVASATVGPYEVTITQPVPDDSPLLKSWLEPDIDGDRCERIGVSISRTRGFIFGPVIGVASGIAGAGAVARAAAGTSQPELVPLLVLDPTGCKSLVAKGQAKVLVNPNGNIPGVIVVDSSGTEKASHPQRNCANSNDFVIDPFGEQNSQIEAADAIDGSGAVIAKGTIYSFALMPGQGNSFAYDPGDVLSGRLKPVPVPGTQVGRGPFDFRYNCKPSIGCDGTPYIDNLQVALGGTGRPAGYLEYGPGPSANVVGPCITQPETPPIVLPLGNWWINCPGAKGLDLSSSMTIEGGSVVFESSVNVGSSTGVLTINSMADPPPPPPLPSCPPGETPESPSDVVVFFRSGNFEKDAQASVVMDRTMVYLENGRIDFGAGSGALVWIAPFTGRFEDLGLWSESVYEHQLGGQANLNIEGAFFTPNAFPFQFTGQGGQYQTKAQFVTYRLLVTGQGVLSMQPDPCRSVPIPIQGVRLIR
jgi:hypothetical protein